MPAKIETRGPGLFRGGTSRHAPADDDYADAIALLTADHRKVEQLFAAFEGAKGGRRKEKLAREICTELRIHAAIEEEFFYPALRGRIDARRLDEARVEHDGARALISDIEAGGPDVAFYEARVRILSQEVGHHVAEAERPADGLFARCRGTDLDLVAMRDAMLVRKEALMALAEDGGLPSAQAPAASLSPA